MQALPFNLRCMLALKIHSEANLFMEGGVNEISFSVRNIEIFIYRLTSVLSD